MGERAKVLLFIDSLGSGGAQRQITLLARELATRDRLAVSLLYYGNLHHMAPMLSAGNVRILRVASEKLSKPKLLLQLLRTIRVEQPTHLISFIDTPNVIAGLAKLLGGRFNWVPSERNLSTDNKGTAWRGLLYLFADCVAANSSSQAAWLKARLPWLSNRILHIPNGIAPELYRAANAEHGDAFRFPIRITCLGRIGWQKNPELLIRAVAILPRQTVSMLRIEWYGEEDPNALGKREQLRLICKEHDIPVGFFPATPNVSEILRESAALILCSRFEGTPNVVLEAMASGVFVIASSVSDNATLLDHGSRGLLFTSDDEAGLADAISNFVEMPMSARMDTVEAAYKFAVDEFSATQMGDRFISALGLPPCMNVSPDDRGLDPAALIEGS